MFDVLSAESTTYMSCQSERLSGNIEITTYWDIRDNEPAKEFDENDVVSSYMIS